MSKHLSPFSQNQNIFTLSFHQCHIHENVTCQNKENIKDNFDTTLKWGNDEMRGPMKGWKWGKMMKTSPINEGNLSQHLRNQLLLLLLRQIGLQPRIAIIFFLILYFFFWLLCQNNRQRSHHCHLPPHHWWHSQDHHNFKHSHQLYCWWRPFLP